MVNSQEWLDKNYPKDIRSEIKRLYIGRKNLENYLDLRDFFSLKELCCSRNQLTSLDVSNCENLEWIECEGNQLKTLLLPRLGKKLVNLKLNDNKLTDLDMYDYSNLEEINCSNNRLTNVEFLAKLPKPPKLTYLNISDNKFSAQDLSFLSKFTNLEKLFIDNNEFFGSLKYLEEMSNLEELGISDTDVDEGLRYLPKNSLKKIHYEIIKRPSFRCKSIKESLEKYYYNYENWKIGELIEKEELKWQLSEAEKKIQEQIQLLQEKGIYPRNILLVGRTGNGKSTLANVLTNSDSFKASAGSISETKNVQSKEFEYGCIKYRVIDTPGFGDIQLTEREVLNRIAEVFHATQDGLNRILFVFRGRFGEAELDIYGKLIKEFKLDDSINNYVTIVRTHFSDFDDENACEEDRESLREKVKIFDSAEIIYIDNDPKSLDEQRAKSREKLLNHLGQNTKKVYKLLKFEELVNKVNKTRKERERLEHELTDNSDYFSGEVIKKQIEELERRDSQQTKCELEKGEIKIQRITYNISLNQGHVLIGNELGSETNLAYRLKSSEEEYEIQQLEVGIEQPLK